jgi:carbon storage regulator
MLVLSRKTGETLRIGRDIRLMVVRIDRDRVRLGIEAPENVRIVRGELEAILAKRLMREQASYPSAEAHGLPAMTEA